MKQQDTSEAFTFITEKLELPLLTLKMDIFHTGKENADDDHKFVNERLLEVAVPEDDLSGRPITLEDCLETYFNNRIEVKRHLDRRATMTSTRSRLSLDSPKAHAFHVESVEVEESRSSSPASSMLQNSVTTSPLKLRHRTPSIIQERIIREEGETSMPSPGGNSMIQASPRRVGSIIRKEVMMPAWQFFSLIRKMPQSREYHGDYDANDLCSLVHGQRAEQRCPGCGSFFLQTTYPWTLSQALLVPNEWGSCTKKYVHRHPA